MRKNSAEYECGWADGSLYATHVTDTFLLPAQRELDELNAQALYIAEVVVTGFGAPPGEFLREANDDLGSQMAKVRNAYAYAHGRGGLNLPTPDIGRAQQVFSAVERYLKNPTDSGDDLRSPLGA